MTLLLSLARAAPLLMGLAASSVIAQVTPTPAAVVESPIVIGTSYALPSRVMGETREINVWLPPGYADSGKTYPVLYVLDGGQAQDFHHISGLVQLGTVAGTTRDVILIGVASRNRQNELAFRATHDASLVTDYPTHGQPDRFRQFLADEVKPWVESRFRTNGDDGVMGESLAGLFIVETFLRQPTLFDRYIAISPSLWWDKGALAHEASALLTAQIDAGAPVPQTLRITVAEEGDEMQADIDEVVAAVVAHPRERLDSKYLKRVGETHATTYHPTALAILRDLYAAPPPPAP